MFEINNICSAFLNFANGSDPPTSLIAFSSLNLDHCQHSTLFHLPSVSGTPVHRTAKNIYIVNLSISGISTAVICIPPTLIQCLYGGKWYLGLLACKLVPTMQGTNILMSSGTITAIAVDRWLCITQVSDGFPRKMTHTKVALINLSIWLISFTIASPILVFQTIQTISLPWTSYSMCVEVWPHNYMKNAFTILILCIQYLLPLIVLPVVHSQVRTSPQLARHLVPIKALCRS